MWHVVRKITNNKFKEETKSMKALDCLDWHEVNASSFYAKRIFGLKHIKFIRCHKNRQMMLRLHIAGGDQYSSVICWLGGRLCST
jgi:hypothetical protein